MSRRFRRSCSRAVWVLWSVGCTPLTDLDGLQGDSAAATSGSSAASTATGGPTGNWLDPVWSARREIVVQASRVAGPLTDFVVYVDLRALHDGAVTPQSDGADIRFSDADAVTPLPHELVANPDGTLAAWVRLPALSATDNTDFYVYYGNVDAPDPPSGKAVWQDLYLGVWHLDDQGAVIADATVNANDGAAIGTTPVAGMVGSAQEFDGDPTVIDIPVARPVYVSDTYTVSIWVQRGTDELIDFMIANMGARVMLGFRDDYDRILATTFGACSAEWPAYSAEADSSLVPNGEWAHVAVTSSYPEIAMLVQGNVESTRTLDAARPPLSSIDNVLVGKGCDAEKFIGLLDEVRITDRALSREWLKTEYNNQSQPDTFLELRAEELAATR